MSRVVLTPTLTCVRMFHCSFQSHRPSHQIWPWASPPHFSSHPHQPAWSPLSLSPLLLPFIFVSEAGESCSIVPRKGVTECAVVDSQRPSKKHLLCQAWACCTLAISSGTVHLIRKPQPWVRCVACLLHSLGCGTDKIGCHMCKFPEELALLPPHLSPSYLPFRKALWNASREE